MSTSKIISTRSDGFGARLLTLLHAMLLAEVYNIKFGFDWIPSPRWVKELDQEFHSLGPKENVFSAQFIDDFFCNPPIALRQGLTQRIEFHELGNDNVKWNEALTSESASIRFHELNIDTLLSHTGNDEKRSIYPELFSRIKFSDPLEFALNQAKSAILPSDVVGLHLRAGDLVYVVFD